MTIQVLDVKEIKEISGGGIFKRLAKGFKTADRYISAANTGIDGATNQNVNGNSPATNAAATTYDVLTYKI